MEDDRMIDINRCTRLVGNRNDRRLQTSTKTSATT